ncbi:hypothetical protein PVAND_008302 [Polypedilum vanderplanki]|uniref:DDHD domain-containing protein n=1 Tax=Polypedilum vanderplanki TaxID=319348 RepID=A0A9J6CAL3_POLVA|nr:hypothetical protein PVAND_008302 [Polypedilum vanderplanki]
MKLKANEKPVFTIGNAPVISDTDNFSEVSLDRDGNSSEVAPSDLQTDNGNAFYNSPLAELDSYNNLQSLHDLNNQLPPPTLDISNNQQQHQQSFDGNFNPISAAFGSAASTVFSTFSSIIKGSASQNRMDEQQTPMTINSNEPPPPMISYQDSNTISNSYSYDLQQQQQSDVNAPPPSFFSPNDETLFQKPTVEMPSNTFRIGGNKKKTYAHIPGLSSSSTNSQTVPQNFNLNPSMPPLPPQPITQVDSMANFPPPQNVYENVVQNSQQQQKQQQQQQSISSKFSFSSLLDKIPVTKNLFGMTDQNPNEYYQGNNEINSSVAFQTPPPPQNNETINYFMPHTQLNEQPKIDNINNNFFNAQQPNLTVNTLQPPSSLVINNDLVCVQKQQPDVTPISGENNNFATVNFFNPQQFNTKPFAKVQQPNADVTSSIESIGKHESQVQSSNSSFMTSPPVSLQQSEVLQQQQPIQFPPQSYSTPSPPSSQTVSEMFSQNNDANAPPPIFFNPNETNDMFKPRLSIDGKPKNPYSNNRTRGVGLYRARTSSSSDSSANQQILLPPAPTASFQEPSQQFFTPTLQTDTIDQAQNQSTLSRPSSVPPQQQTLIESSVPYPSAPPLSSLVPSNVNETNVAFMTPSLTVMQKSDLNVPENEDLISSEQKQQQSATVSNVSNFFAYDNQSKVNEQKSALHFFQDQPEVSSQPVLNEQQQVNNNNNNSSTFNAINFFNMEQEPKTDLPQNRQQSIMKGEEEEEFNSPITSSIATTTIIQGNNENDTINDITDKMESLSACSRSTLSLFATSELDSTMNQKQLSSAPVQSLIPKYLEQQPPIGESLKGEPLVNENTAQKYRPIYCHWFYQNLYWHPFSMSDSLAIDQAILNDDNVVCTSGGRYEVNIKDRRRSSIYWTSGSNIIRKCSWFYIDSLNSKNGNIVPFEENLAIYLEKEYERAMTHEAWNQKINLPESNDFIIMKDSSTIEYHKMGYTMQVKRGMDEFNIDDGEEGIPQHLILCVSSFGDKIDENADEIRSKCLEGVQQYYSEEFDCGRIKRIEVLPITLNSIDVLKMNEFNNIIASSSSFKTTATIEINEHIMRTMLYSNENFYQKIMNHLAFSLNEIASKFKQRNPNFDGGISLIASSYEALFLFDLLTYESATSEFWKLNFEVSKFFACGMPTNLLMIRNADKLNHGFELTGCRKLFNIIHPKDAIGQRIEPFIIPEYSSLPPEMIDNLSRNERIDFMLTEESLNDEQFSAAKYFSSETLIKRILNEIYGANCLDSGNL